MSNTCTKLQYCFKALEDVPIQVTNNGHQSVGNYRLRCLPYFYLLGFPKCGTTDIRSRLVLHAYIKDAVCKEPQFFDRRRFEHGNSNTSFPKIIGGFML